MSTEVLKKSETMPLTHDPSRPIELMFINDSNLSMRRWVRSNFSSAVVKLYLYLQVLNEIQMIAYFRLQ